MSVLLTYAAVRGVTVKDLEKLAEERRLGILALDGLLPEEMHNTSSPEGM